MHDQSVCVCQHVFCHTNGIRCLSQQHHLESYRPGFTPNSDLMYPCHPRCPVPPTLFSQDETNVLPLNEFSINTTPRRGCRHQFSPQRNVVQLLTHAPARNETSLTHRHHTRSDQSSCAPKKACSLKPVVLSASSPTPNTATRCSSAASFRQRYHL